MEFIYVFTNGSEWEDIIVFLSKEEAMQKSMDCPTCRVEIFSKTQNQSGYSPTYNYYKNGIYYDNNQS